jgi:hypothetical protein
MGLDITAYEVLGELIQTNHEPEPDDWRHAAFLYPYPNNVFPGRDDGITEGWYRVGGETECVSFSYSGYYMFRGRIIEALHGVGIREYWDDEAKYGSTPLRDILNFADNEGILGPRTSAKLHLEAQGVAQKVRDHFFRTASRDVDRLEAFFRCFKLAAGTGVVRFS